MKILTKVKILFLFVFLFLNLESLYASDIRYYVSYLQRDYIYHASIKLNSTVLDTVFIADSLGTASITGYQILQNSYGHYYTKIMPASFPSGIPFDQVRPFPAGFIIQTTPLDIGSISDDTLLIYINVYPNVIRIPISGNKVGSSIITPNKTTIDFGSLAPNSGWKYDTLSLKNTGSDVIDLNSVHFESEVSDFTETVIGTQVSSIPVGGTYRLAIGFNPINPGSYSDVLVVKNTSANSPNLKIGINAAVYTPAKISLGVSSINFGTLGYMQKTIDTSIVITNTSDAENLIITQSYFLPVDSMFQILSALPFTIPHGASASLKIRLTPKRTGIFYSELHILNTSSNSPDAIIGVTGNITGSSISTTPKTINFGTIGQYSDSKDTVITIQNSGVYNLQIRIANPKDANLSLIASIQSADTIISPGGQYKFKVRITPLKLSTITDTIKIYNNSTNLPTDFIIISAVVSQPNLLITPQNYDFGRTSLTTPVIYKTFYMQNNYRSSIKVSGRKLSGDTSSFYFVNPPAGIILSANQVDSFQLVFNPKTLGTKTAQLKISSDDPLAANLYYTLSGVGGGRPVLSISPAKLNFGEVTSSTDTSSYIIIQNDGNLYLDISGKTITGNDNAAFSIISGSGPVSLDRKKADTIRIKVNSATQTIGDKTAQFQAVSNDSSNLNPKVDLFASIKSPAIIKSLSVLVFDTTTIGDSKDSTFTIRNDGNSPLIISGVLTSDFQYNDFIVSGVKAGEALEPGTTRTISVKFKPLDIGTRSSRVLIRSNDPRNPEISVIVRGFAKLPVKPVIEVSNRAIDFGYVEPGKSKDTSFVIKNTGIVNLQIDSIYLTGKNKSFFSLPALITPVIISPSASQNINVKFASAASDTVKNPTAVINIRSNDTSNKVISINLSATLQKQIITKPAIAFDTVINFMKVPILDSSIMTLIIRNISYSKVIIDNISFDASNENVFSFGNIQFPLVIDSLGSYSLPLKFKPKEAKDYSIYLNINSSQITDIIPKVHLLGKGSRPVISISQDTLDFGNVEINTHKQMNLPVINSGEVILRIDSLKFQGNTGGEFGILNSALPILINPGNTANIQLDFNPLIAGLQVNSGLIIINNDPVMPRYLVPLKGKGIKSGVVVSDTSLNFQKAALGDTLSKILKITNNLTVNLTITQIDFESNPDQAFFISPAVNTPVNIQPSGSLEITVKYYPKTNTTYQSYLRVYSSAFSGNLQKISLSGGVGSPLLKIPASLTFGKTGISLSNRLPMILENNGDAILKINNIILGGSDSSEFLMDKKVYPLRINSGGKDSIYVTFSPVKEGIKNVKITVLSNDLINNGEVSISAEGTKQNLSANKPSIDFGEVSISKFKNDSVTLKNTGSASIIINSFSISGTNSNSFSILSSVNSRTLLAGDSNIVIIKFQPDSGGYKSAGLDISTNDALNPKISIPLTGTATTPSMIVSVKSIDFPSQKINSSRDSIVIIRNNGKGYLFINSTDINGDTASFSLVRKLNITEISPGKTDSILCRFKPISIGQKTASIKIVSNDPGNAGYSIPLSGNGAAGSLMTSVSKIDFGKILAFFTKDSSLIISNNGSDKLTINKISIVGADSSKFKFISQPSSYPFSLSSGNSFSLGIRFVPVIAGTRNAGIRIESDDVSNPVTLIGLSGSGSVPDLVMESDLIASEGADYAFKFHITENSLPDKIKIFYKIGGAKKYDSSDITVPGSMPESFPFSFPKYLITYYGLDFKIKFTWKNSDVVYPLDSITGSYAIQVKMTSLKSSFKLLTRNYFMTTVPLIFPQSTLIDEIVKNLGSVGNINWRIFHWMNSDYIEYLDRSIWQPAPGDGFWLIARESKYLNFSNCLTVPTNSAYKKKLYPGWNQIGNPFLFPISISDIQIPANKNIPKNLWAWSIDGEYYLEKNMLYPWEGYFIYNFENDSVEISMQPVQYSASLLSKNTENKLPKELSNNEWIISLNLGIGNKQNHYAEIGCLNDSYDEWDINDLIEAPPMPDEYVSIRFPHDEWTKYAGKFIRDFRAKHTDGYIWDMEVINTTNNKSGSISPEIFGEIPADFIINIFDYDNNSGKNIYSAGLTPQVFSFNFSDNAVKKLRITIGKKEFIDKDISEQKSLARNYRLYQNYPNPFNPSTVIEYQLSAQSKTNLSIYNLLGERIRTLINREQSAGRYSVEWDARDDNGNKVSSGVYYYRLETGNYTEMRKMIYLR
jgi:hypothetical protein